LGLFGFEIGFDWEKRTQFWPKIGFVLALFGFVFALEKSIKNVITASNTSTCVNRVVFKIGFVLHIFVIFARSV